MELRFEWDPEKGERNFVKHGVLFDEARTVFADPLGKIVEDSRHSLKEQWFVLLGHSHHERLLAVMFTDRSETIRLISARQASHRERREYEKG